jgi:hypothetical protein
MNSNIAAFALWAAVAIGTIPAHSQTRREATIEVGTKARLVLQSQLSSKLNEVGDAVVAILEEPIYINGLLIMPRDAVFQGRVTSVKPAGRSHKSAQMSIVFDKVLTPWGDEAVSVVLTAIDDWDKNEKLRPDSEGKVNGGHRGEKTVDNVIRGAEVGALGTGTVIAGSGTRNVSQGTSGQGGVAIGAGMLGGLLLTKGGEVRLAPGAILRIAFVMSLTLPVTQDPSRIP